MSFPVPDATRQRIVQLRRQGLSYNQLHLRFGLHKATVARILSEAGETDPNYVKGPKCKTPPPAR